MTEEVIGKGIHVMTYVVNMKQLKTIKEKGKITLEDDLFSNFGYLVTRGANGHCSIYKW